MDEHSAIAIDSDNIGALARTQATTTSSYADITRYFYRTPRQSKTLDA